MEMTMAHNSMTTYPLIRYCSRKMQHGQQLMTETLTVGSSTTMRNRGVTTTSKTPKIRTLTRPGTISPTNFGTMSMMSWASSASSFARTPQQRRSRMSDLQSTWMTTLYRSQRADKLSGSSLSASRTISRSIQECFRERQPLLLKPGRVACRINCSGEVHIVDYIPQRRRPEQRLPW